MPKKTPKVRKIPQRQCVGCRTMKNKRDLFRVVRSPEGEISLDFVGKKSGRGAYVCPDVECLRRARKSRALERAFSMPIPPEVYAALEKEMEAGLPPTVSARKKTAGTVTEKNGEPMPERNGHHDGI